MTSSDPDVIRRQIEDTRRELSYDVDALNEKVNPARVVDRRVSAAKGRISNLKEKVMGSDPYSGHSSGGGVRQAASHAADRVSGTASSATASVQDAASSAASSVQDAAATAADAVQQAPQAIRRQTRGNPLAAGLIAFGAGWLVSSLLPATRREQELADQAKQVAQEKVAPVAQQVAGEVRENLREPAQQAVDSVKATAQDAKDTVADEGRLAAQDVSGRAQDAAGTVRTNASS